MIKKCKITNIHGGKIFGVTKEPIGNGKVLELNSGQILSCIMSATVDEILEDGTLVRLNKDNYKIDNSNKKSFIVDETEEEFVPAMDSTPFNNEENNLQEDTNIPSKEANNVANTAQNEDNNQEEIPSEEVKNDMVNTIKNEETTVEKNKNNKRNRK